jgi:hypothetical protein
MELCVLNQVAKRKLKLTPKKKLSKKKLRKKKLLKSPKQKLP